MICSVFRISRRKNGKVVKDRLYRGQYRLTPQDKIVRVPLNTPDKSVAAERLRKIVVESQKVAEGLLPSQSLRDAAKKPLQEHLDLYIATRETKGNSSVYIYDTRRQIETLIHDCDWVHPSDITAISFEQWRNRTKKYPKTANDYLAAMRAFVRWMCKRNLITADPLTPVDKVKTNVEKKHPRRALTDDEMERLIELSEWRSPMYLTAVFTGLRRGELESLTWGDVHLDAVVPYLTVRASQSKNGKCESLPLHLDVVMGLKSIRPRDADPNAAVFKKMYRTKQFQKDLLAAGIPYKDDHGRYADFHAFRHTFNTNLAREDVGERTRMGLMRHSDSKLTNKTYTDESQLPTVEAIRRLHSYLKPASPLRAQGGTQENAPSGHQASSSVPVPAVQNPVNALET